jgi:DNA mismatch repair protein MutS
MQVDKTTLADLSIFHNEEEQSVFHHLNFTHTNGGREYLRQILANPLDSLKDILDNQQTIRVLMEVENKWPLTVTNGAIMMIERFYESPVTGFAQQINLFNALLYKFINKHDFLLIRYSVGHTIDFTRGLQQIVTTLQEQTLSRKLANWVDRISTLLNRAEIQELMEKDKTELSTLDVLKYGGYILYQYKNAALELVDIYSRMDAYLSLAQACKKYSFSFPEIEESNQPYVKANGLYHLLLSIPVSYEVELSENRNFLFLTGANMAGKSTFIKAVGISVYLAHLGMGVPARKLQLSYLDGLLSNIQVVDNILKGESFFFNEVQRIKSTIEKISDGKNWLILIDELFKGTNQQDAVKCSTTVIEGLRKMKNALFVLSTHLYEIGDDLRKYKNIQFHYFETSIEDDQLLFSYQLKEGISNDRLGYLILKKEGVVELLDKL